MDVTASRRQTMGKSTTVTDTEQEQRCVYSLRQAMKNGDSKAEVDSLKDLGDVHLDKGKVRRHGWDFTWASALYNAALVRCKESQVRETLIHRIKYTEKLFLKRVAKVNKHDTAMYDYQTDLSHKAELTRIRDMCRERLVSLGTMCDYSENPMEDVAARERERGRAEAVRELYRDITREMKGFITCLVEECFSVLGRPPCKYAMIGMGSFARQEMTPYSDLEFAILVEEGKGTEENKTYFRILTHLLHLKVLNLGETILPSMAIPYLNDFGNQEHNWLYDSVTPRGFSFDGAMPWASKTPLGRGKTKKRAALELIMTPIEMAELQTEERSVKEGYHLASVLSKVDLITGDGDILAIYDELVSQKLDKELPNYGQITLRRHRSLASCLTITNNFNLDKTRPMSGELYDVKQVVYRFLSMCFRHIGDLCGTAGKTLTDIIEELQKGGILTSVAAHNVRVAAAIADEIRLRTYCTYGKQREHMAIVKPVHTKNAMGETKTNQASSTPGNTCTKAKPGTSSRAIQNKDEANRITEASISPHRVYHIDDSNLLHRFYMTVLPLQSLLWERMLLRSSHGGINLLAIGQLMREVFAIQCLYGGALERGKAFNILQQYARAEECLRNALQEDPNNDDLVIELSSVVVHLRKFHDVQQLLHPVLDRTERYLKNDTDSYYDTVSNVRRFNEVLEAMCMSLFREFVDGYGHGEVRPFIHRHYLEQAVSASGMSKLDLAQVYSRIAVTFAMSWNPKQSEMYLHRALENLNSEPNPGGKILQKLKRAEVLVNIAIAYNELLFPPAQIIRYAQLAREAYRECVGADTPHLGLVDCTYLLGKANERLEEWKEVIEWYEQVIEMASALGEGPGYKFVISSLSAMGKAYLQLGEVEKGLELLQQAESLLPDIWDDLDAPVAMNTIYDLDAPVAMNTIYEYGSALEKVGRVVDARERFQKILGLPVRGRAYEVSTKAKSNDSLGLMFQRSGQLNKAIEYMMQSYSLYVQVCKNDVHGNVNAREKVKAVKGAMLAAIHKGSMELQLDKSGTALQTFSAVLELLDSTGIEFQHAFPTVSERITRYKLYALMWKGYCLFDVSDLQRATAVYTEAVDTFRDFYDTDAHHLVLALFLTAKGRLHHIQGDTETATKCYSEAWAMITREQTAGQSGYEAILSALFSFCANLDEPNSPSGKYATDYHLQEMLKQPMLFFSKRKLYGET